MEGGSKSMAADIAVFGTLIGYILRKLSFL